MKLIEWSNYPTPDWSETLLQGLAYWIGYKHQLYRHHPLKEGAIIGEATPLIDRTLDKSRQLRSEVDYKKLGATILKGYYVDLAIFRGEEVDSIIEVKRASAPKKEFEKDLKKLAEVSRLNKDTRCFLLVTSQGKRPKKYVTNSLEAENKERKLGDIVYKVRRVCKALHSKEKFSKSHFACLIEVKTIA